ncbi:MAG TPA: DNA translocase FtsK 4TM domain-containing protein [Candidatus Acidoferrales bacterium]|nr:DNA translocase FtsK 4TM domain-containing protein [Candidatus Acidoferrales bacterium]
MGRSRAATKDVIKDADDHEPAQLLNEVAGVVTLAAAIFALVSFLSFQHGQTKVNLGGPVGYGLASALMQAFGLAVYLLPVMLSVLGTRLFRSRLEEASAARAGAALLLLLTVSVVLGLVFPQGDVVRAGGWFGGFVASVLRDACGLLGAYVVAAVLLLLALMFSTKTSLRGGAALVAGSARDAVGRWRARRAEKPAPRVAINRKRAAVADGPGPVIVLGEESAVVPEKKPRRGQQEVLPFVTDSGYQTPSLDLLDVPRHAVVRVDEEALRKSSEILEAKLANFGIEGKVVAVRPGPVITTFEIEPAPGVKVNRIVTLQDDLAMALRAVGVRILAPVPGKAVVGIEVANAKREQVFLKEILESEPFAQSPSTLTLALGKDSAGNPTIGDLARMPHLMLAGATGTGKSVSLNAMIMSILFKSSPRDVRFVMIDLKMLELSLYEDLPHLLVPVVTDPKKAVVVLKNLVEQMDQRYRLLKEKGVRNIDGYNRLMERDEDERRAGVVELTEVVDEDDAEPAEPEALHHERLPKIVVIIDELADLMMTVGRQVEEPITRLAQKARACGMHLILATQRPSVDVITGIIKANFPARISFQVTARVDSRTILDCIGAERLLGHGDMLYLPPGTARVQRLHGAFVSEAEIRKVTDFAKQQARPSYALDLLEDTSEDEDGAMADDGYDDVMYDQAVRLVTESRQASISWVQRRLRVGYNRAARMIERMEREGVVSPSDNGRPREVLAQRIEE